VQAPFHPGLVSFGFHGLEDGVVAVKLLACQTWLGKRQTIFETALQVMNMTGMELILIAGLFGVIGLGVLFLRRGKLPKIAKILPNCAASLPKWQANLMNCSG
jgi:hypothetical protein